MIETWSSGNPSLGMDESLLTELRDQVSRHPWWRARCRLVLALLRSLGVPRNVRLLDAGCGWGVTLEALEHTGIRADGLDISRAMLERLDRPERRLFEADVTRPLPHHNYDIVLALDLIEHLDDDRGAVANLAKLVRDGGRVVVSVPACPAIYGEFDVVQGHRRRYTPKTLRAAFQGSGLVIERSFCWGAWLLPLLRWQRSRSGSARGSSTVDVYRKHSRLPPRALRWALDTAFAVEQPLALRGLLPCGTSLFAVARKGRAGVARGGDSAARAA